MTGIPQAVANLDTWLETMRCPGGYGGPVVHWWQSCLSYTGPGLDWRYQGIILGYLTLWQKTGERRWLAKACRAGDDLVQGQLPGGNFRGSCFELNPYAGGTPHEAACDLALLRLALALRDVDDYRWRCYPEAAARNLRAYFIGRLWDESAQCFRDHPEVPSLVPNKACTLAEALFAWAEIRRDDHPIERYALPTLRAVLALQINTPGRLEGAIPQNRLRNEVVDAYFPFYIARCVPALLLAHRHTDQHCWLDAAIAAVRFIERCLDRQSLLPQALYPRGRNRYPAWIAPLADVLYAAALLEPFGMQHSICEIEARLLAGQLPGGGFLSARGFAAQVSQAPANGALPDFRDCIPVVGWCDKVFHYLSTQLPEGASLPQPQTRPFEIACQASGRPAIWTGTDEEMRLRSDGGETLYLWPKGQPWARITAPELSWK